MLDIPVSTARAIIKKYEQHGTTALLPRSGRPKKISSRAERNTLKNIAAKARLTSKDIQKSLAAADVRDSTVRKLFSKNGIHERVARKKPLLSKKNVAVGLQFAKEYIGKLKHSGDQFCGQTNQKLNFLAEKKPALHF
ncbi:hypothetical protein LDENG_00005040 [Lucifuga dentata]|nr:hypothetical protein LDENG_00005040 [Lucifuga dentata]